MLPVSDSTAGWALAVSVHSHSSPLISSFLFYVFTVLGPAVLWEPFGLGLELAHSLAGYKDVAASSCDRSDPKWSGRSRKGSVRVLRADFSMFRMFGVEETVTA